MKSYFIKWTLAICLLFCVGYIYAQRRCYCEVKGIEKSLSSGLKIIFDFGTKASYKIYGETSVANLNLLMRMGKK